MIVLLQLATVTLNFFSSLQLTISSYLGYPRIHFAGQFRADSNTRNNYRCWYMKDRDSNIDYNYDWNFNGTNEFQFFNTSVTSVIYKNGTTSTKDPVIGKQIIGNLDRPYGKLVGLNVQTEEHSAVYGLNFGIKWSRGFPSSPEDVAFQGKWSPNILYLNGWQRSKCYNEEHYGPYPYQSTFPMAAQSTTMITGIKWNNPKGSLVLKQLQKAVGNRELSVRITLFHYTRAYLPYAAYNFTLGYVVGTIGTFGESDSLNVPGQRRLVPTGLYPVGLLFEPDDSCYRQNIMEFDWWMNSAPFEVDWIRNEIRLDLSNSIPSTIKNTLRTIGVLRLGILIQSESCVYLLGDISGIPYMYNEELPLTSGIYTIPVDSALMTIISQNPLVIAQVLTGRRGSAETCGSIFHSSRNFLQSIQILLQESDFYIRPKNHFVDRIERDDSSVQILYVTRFGLPAADINVRLKRVVKVLPNNGLVPATWNVKTDQNGYATFKFYIQDYIPPKRHYDSAYRPCKPQDRNERYSVIPIAGQVYAFGYCVAPQTDDFFSSSKCSYEFDYTISILAYSDVFYTLPYTWVKDVEPIFSEYALVTPIMVKILNIASYEAVTKPYNIKLLNHSLRLDFNDPSYMPATRDLSPTKINMILKWLENPIYDLSGSIIPEESAECKSLQSDLTWISSEYYSSPRCKKEELHFTKAPQEYEKYFLEIFEADDAEINNYLITERPLFKVASMPSYKSNAKIDNTDLICTEDNVAKQLQTAIKLEWITIPAYLTTLYSIVEGCNVEIYEIIRSVIMEEMFHMTLAANMLIAMNRSPVIDDAGVAPSYPSTLPGGVMPGLTVTLEKLSLAHIHDKFMAIELPQKTLVGGSISSDSFTIGAFYNEIIHCIDKLYGQGKEIFYASTVDRQVKWPWDPAIEVGPVNPVVDSLSAKKAIKWIRSQGEGAGIMLPKDIENRTYSHFFKFEEIVCQRQLKKMSKDFYSYMGNPIPFNPKGVWPMRSNPTTSTIPLHTNCYTESKVFHEAYRAFLQKLDEVFNGKPDEIFVAVELMESLQVHAKKLMWIKYDPDSVADFTTCGPVWEYHWPDS